MPPQLSENDIDDILYFTRTGELQDFNSSINTLCQRENITLSTLLLMATDPSSGNGPLHMAAANGHSKILSYIIAGLAESSPQNASQLAVLNAQNGAGNTALHWAALNGNMQCVKALIDAGADPTIANTAGHDAVYEAELNDKKDVVEWVLKESEGLETGIANEHAEEDGQKGEDAQVEKHGSKMNAEEDAVRHNEAGA